LTRCAEICSHNIHEHCFQRDGTRHVTLFNGNIDAATARKISFPGTFEPITIEIDDWVPSDYGKYLLLKKSTTAKLLRIVERITGGRIQPQKGICDHISLYRLRQLRGPAKNQAIRDFRRIRKELAGKDWGTVQGVSIRIKLLGTEWNECKVLAGV